MRFFIALILSIISATAAAAERPSHMSCETRAGLINHVLDNLTAATQLLNNSFGQTVSPKDLAAGVCGLKQFVRGSVASDRVFWADRSSQLIYVTFKVEYPTNTGSGWNRVAYAVDAVVPVNLWQVGEGRKMCGRYNSGHCLIPRSCDVLDTFWQSGNLIGFNDRQAIPDYVFVPRGSCGTYVIN